MMPIRIAIIGLGWVAVNRHIPALRRNPAFRLVGVVSRHGGRAAEAAARFGIPRFAASDDFSHVDWLDEIDAVVIATPPAAHAGLTCAALEKGKHVLVEKPFAMTVEEGERMVTVARAQKRVLAVVHNFPFSRGAKKLIADLERGKLGSLRRADCLQLGNPRRLSPGWVRDLPLGLFYDESPHVFSLLRRIAGERLVLKHASGMSFPDGKPAQVSLFYQNSDRLSVSVSCRYDSALSEWYVTVTGEQALGILDVYRDIYIKLPNDGAHRSLDVLRTSVSAMAQHIWQYVPNGVAYSRGRLDYGNDEVFARFVRAIRGEEGVLAGIGAEDALAVLRLQHEALADVKEHWLT
jgi:scyllo-inositol 2-dehydrogenase (NADP+)